MASQYDELLQQIQPIAQKIIAGAVEHARDVLQPQLQRVAMNFSRARRLLALHKAIATVVSPGGDATPADDLLRATTVFTHASLEDFLRTLACSRLPSASSAVLSTIPLLGTGNRAEKFSLGQLAAHRTATVQAIIEDSVREHLSRTSFNSPGDIAALVKNCSIDSDRLSQHYPVLDEMIRRRHQIVHQADLVEVSGAVSPAPITVDDVERWLTSALGFVVDVLTQLGLEAAQTKVFAE